MTTYEVNYGGLRVVVGLLEDSQDSHGRPKIHTAQLAFRPDPDLTGFGRDEQDAIVDLLRTARDEGYLPDPDEDEDYDGPAESDGFVSLGTGAGGVLSYHVMLEGVCCGNYPTNDIAVYELAKAMSASGSFPAAWMEGEHGPGVRSIDGEVRQYHDEGGTGLLPLPGVRFEPGDLVVIAGEDWNPWVVIGDYGDNLGLYVHTQGDRDVTMIVTGQAGRISKSEDASS
jgi:hypothetical protein